ncbi:hypothetical protein [Thalassospira marina]|uniref:Uncharacterized protein n=1 Tax=Thalassospira marina TaxID=2048283 RepID=A0A2N3KXY9_9PROT|nr:hypothetical protein [Thalassospira marina]PKR55408.1 hypothetical protein COO20_04355 [Thalassospira marina]
MEEDVVSTPEGQADDLDAIITGAMNGGSDGVEDEPSESTGRDERGRFKASDEADGTEEAPEEDPAGTGADTSEGDDQEQEEETRAGQIDLPADWPDELKAKVAALPVEAQAAVVETTKGFQADYTRKTMAIAEERKRYEQLEQVFAPHRNSFRQAGITEAQAVQGLLAAEAALNRDPKAAITHLAQHYGVDLSQQAEGGENPAHNPELSMLRNELTQVKGQLSQFEAEKQQRHVQDLTGRIETFATAKDASGNILHPHFDAVRNVMSTLLSSGQVQDLEKAYEQAVWLDPGVRQRMLADAEAKTKAEEDRKRKESLDKARRAGSGPRGSSPNTKTMPDDLDGIITHSMKMHGF